MFENSNRIETENSLRTSVEEQNFSFLRDSINMIFIQED